MQSDQGKIDPRCCHALSIDDEAQRVTRNTFVPRAPLVKCTINTGRLKFAHQKTISIKSFNISHFYCPISMINLQQSLAVPIVFKLETDTLSSDSGSARHAKTNRSSYGTSRPATTLIYHGGCRKPQDRPLEKASNYRYWKEFRYSTAVTSVRMCS